MMASSIFRSVYVLSAVALLALAGCAPAAPDTSVPVIAITSPATGTIVASSSVTVSGSVSDSGGNLDTVVVQVGAQTAEATVDGSTFTATVTSVPDGAAAITAVATDDAGFTETAGPVAITIDAATPVVTIVSPAEDDQFGYLDDVVAGGSLDIEVLVSVADPDGTGVDGQTVTVAGCAAGSGTAVVSGSSATVPCALVAGANALIASVSDMAGNAGTSAAVNVTATLTTPTIASITPASQLWGTASSNAQNGTGAIGQLDVTVTTTNVADGLPVTLFRNGSVLATQNAQSNSVLFDNITLLEGTNSFTASASDAAGNPTPAATAMAATYDGVDPAISVDSIPGVAALNAAEAFAQSGAANALDFSITTTAENGRLVELFRGATSMGTVAASNGTAFFNNIALLAGAQTFTAAVTDLAGNGPITSTGLVVDYDSVAPTVSFTSPTSTLFGKTSSASQSGTTGQLDIVLTTSGAQDGQLASLRLNGGTPVTAAVSSNSVTFSNVVLVEGTNAFTVTVTDLAGNVSTQASYTTSYDSIDPAVSIDSIPGVAALSAPEALAQSGLANALDFTIATTAENGRLVELFRDATSMGTVAAASGTAFFNNIAILSSSQTFTATVSDAAGNGPITSTGLVVVYDSAAPTVSFTSPSSTLFGRTSSSTQSGTIGQLDITLTTSGAQDGQLVSLRLNGAAPVTSAVSTNVATFLNVALSEGTNAFTATVTDLAGNVSTQAAYTTTYDSIDPALSIDPIPGAAALSAAEAQAQSGAPNALDFTITTTAENGRLVELFRGATSMGTVAATNGTAFFNNIALLFGSQTFTATVSDAAGNGPITSAGLVVTYDNIAPAVTVISPATALWGKASSDSQNGAGAVGQLDVNVTTTDAEAQMVTLFQNGVALAPVAVVSGDAFFNNVVLLQGANTFTASVSDAAGNPSGTSPSSVATYDGNDPVIVIAAPAAVTFNVQQTIDQSGTSGAIDITVSTDAEAGRMVTLKKNTVTVTSQAVANGAAFFNDVVLTSGVGANNTFTAEVTDLAGNGPIVSIAYAPAFDSAAPSVTGITPASQLWGRASSNGQNGPGGDGQLDITVNTSGATDGVLVTLFRSGTALGSVAVASNSAFFNDIVLNVGANSFTAAVAGQIGGASPGSVATYDNVDPLIAVTAPSVPSFNTAETLEQSGLSGAIDITVTTDAEAGRLVTLRKGGVAVGSTVPVANGAAVFQNVVLTEGAGAANTFTAEVSDAALNGPGVSAAYAPSYDATAPTIASITPASQTWGKASSNGQNGTGGDGQLDITVTTSGAEDTRLVSLFRNGALVTTAAVTTNVAFFDNVTLSAGSNSFTASVSDLAGNASPAATAMIATYDSVDPVVAITVPTATSFNIASSNAQSGANGAIDVTVTTDAEAGTNVSLRKEGVVVAGPSPVANGAVTFQNIALTDGAGTLNTFLAEATDAAGNTGASAVYEPSYDGTAPTIGSIGPATALWGRSTSDAQNGGIGVNGVAGQLDITVATTGAVNGQPVSLFRNGVLVTTENVFSNNAIFDNVTLNAGANSFTASVADVAGNVSAPSTASVATYDDLDPVIAIDAIPGVASLSAAEALAQSGLANALDFTITTTAENGQIVTLLRDGVSAGTQAATNGTAIFNDIALTPGSDVYTASVSDLAANGPVISAGLTVDYDNSAPTVSFTTPSATLFGRTSSSTQSGAIGQLDITLTTSGAQDGQLVSLRLNGAAAITSTVTTNSASFANVVLAEGTNAFTATVTDAAGNVSVQAGYTTTYDSVDPTISVDPVVGASSLSAAEALAQSGSPNALDITISTSAENGRTVTLLRDGVSAGTQTVTDGTASFNDVALAAGSDVYSASVSDIAGNGPVTSSSNLTVDYDNVPPSVVFTTPSATLFGRASSATQSGATGQLDITLTASGAQDGQLVTLRLNGGAAVTSAVSSNSATFNNVVLAEGTNAFTATVTDAAGNVSPQAAYATTYDSIDPTIAVDPIPHVASLSAAEAQAQSGAPNALDFTITTSAENGQVVTLLRDAVVVTTATVTAGTATFDNVQVIFGTDVYTASVSDFAGNGAVVSAGLTVDYDNAIPTLAFTLPSATLFGRTSSQVQSGTIGQLDITITTGGAQDGQLVSLRLNGGAPVTSAVASTTAVFNNQALVEGTNAFTATVTDAAGNVSAQASYTTTYDSIDPTISVDAIPGVASLSAAEALAQSGTANSLDITITTSAENGRSVTLLRDGVSVISAAVTDGTAFFNDVLLAAGSDVYSAQVSDLAGNGPVTSTSNLTVDYDNSAPTVSFTTPSATLFGRTSSSTQSGTIGQLDITLTTSGAQDAQLVSLRLNGAAPVTSAVTASSASFLNVVLTEGTNAFTATVTDAAGNISTQASYTTTYDSLDPAIAIDPIQGVASLSAAEASAQANAANALDITVTTTAENGRVVELFRGATFLASVPATNGTAFFNNAGLVSGTQTFTATVTDLAGNGPITSTGLVVNYDNTLPSASVTAPSALLFGRTSSQTQSGTIGQLDLTVTVVDAEVGSTVNLFKNGSAAGTATVIAGFTAPFPNVALAEGTNAFTAIVTDAAGNQSALSPTYAPVYDSINPTIAVQTIPQGPAFSAAEALAQSGTANRLDITVITNAESGQVVTLTRAAQAIFVDTNANSDGTKAFFNDVTISEPFNNFTAVVSDLAGNSSGVSASYDTTYDATAPTLIVSIPNEPAQPVSGAESNTQNNFFGTNGAIGRLDVRVTATAGIENGQAVNLFNNGAVVGTVNLVASVADFDNVGGSGTGSNLGEGLNRFTAVASDVVGNTGTSLAKDVTYDSVLNIVVVSPQPGALFTAEDDDSAAIGIQVSIAATTDAESGTSVTFNPGAVAGVVSSGVAQAQVTLSEGSNSITASVTDAAGNSATSVVVSATLDTIAPSITFPATVAEGRVYTSSEDDSPASSRFQKTLPITVTDAGSGVEGQILTLRANGRGPFSSPVATGLATTSAELLEGSNELIATVRDAAGNVATSTPFRVDVLSGPLLSVRATVRTFGTGTPVSSALVQLSRSPDFSRIVRSGTTDATGQVTITNVQAGPYWARAWRDVDGDGIVDYNGSDVVGFASARVLVAPEESSLNGGLTFVNIDTATLAGSCQITGFVTDDTAMSVSWPAGVRTWVASATTDFNTNSAQFRSFTLTNPANGSFALNEVGSSSVNLIYGKDTNGNLRPDFGEPLLVNFGSFSCGASTNFTLPPPAQISGKVTDGPGFTISVNGNGCCSGPKLAQTRPLQDGTYQLLVFSDSFTSVRAFLDADGDGLLSDDDGSLTSVGFGTLEPNVAYVTFLSTLPITTGVRKDVSGVNLGIPALRTISGQVNAVTDFRVDAQPFAGSMTARAWMEPTNRSYTIQTFPGQYQLRAFDDRNFNASVDPNEHSWVQLTTDVSTGDSTGQTFFVAPFFDIVNGFTLQDVPVDGVRDTIANPGDNFEHSGILRNRGGDATNVQGILFPNGGNTNVTDNSTNLVAAMASRTSAAVNGTLAGLTGAAQPGTIEGYQLNVEAADFSSFTSTWTTYFFYEFVGGVLLVDDDAGQSPDARPRYVEALDAINNIGTTNYPYEIFNTGSTAASGPGFPLMSQFGSVVWFSGTLSTDALPSNVLLGSDEGSISNFVTTGSGSQRFALFSSGYLDKFDSLGQDGNAFSGTFTPGGSFPQNILRIDRVSQDEGNNSTSADFGFGYTPKSSGDGSDAQIDCFNFVSVQVEIFGVGYSAGCLTYSAGGSGRAYTSTVPLESFTDPLMRQNMMGAAISF